MPSAELIWSRAVWFIWLGVAYFAVREMTFVLLDYWLLDRLGYSSVFWTNFWAAAILFVIGALVTAFELLIPTVVFQVSATTRRFLIHATILGDVLIGYLLATQATKFLLLLNGESFGVDDPVFGHDVGFYVFTLPAIKAIVSEIEIAAMLVLGLSAACSIIVARDRIPAGFNRVLGFLGIIASPLTLAAIGLFGVGLAVDTFLGRYDLLYKDNISSSVYQGAQALDVSGIFSTVNSI
jgi:uncharacterized membrane protein (UPF0182 family)